MKRNKDLFSEVVVGVFMLVVFVVLAYFTIVVSGVDILVGRARVVASVQFPDVGGLKDRDSVMYRGMKVGTVEQIDLRGTNVVVMMRVNRDVILRETCRISVEPLSLLGGNYLLLEEGQGATLPLEATSFTGVPPVNFMRDAGKVLARFSEGEALSSILPESVRTNLEQTTARLSALVTRLERGEGTVGKLLSSDESLYNDLTQTVASAKMTLAHTSKISERLEKGEGTLGKLLSSDETVYADLKTVMSHAAAISTRLEQGEGTLGKLLSKDDAVWTDLKQSVSNLRTLSENLQNKEGLLARLSSDRELADNAATLLANLKDVSSKLAQGEGTLGKIIADPEMYNEVNAVIKDIRQVIDNYRDTTPITTFGSLATGAL